jgi:hypothetical protein
VFSEPTILGGDMRNDMRRLAVLLSLFLALLPAVWAEDILFIGNSFTYANDIPKMVEVIAMSKGKTAGVRAVTKGGQDWSYHLAQPVTDDALKNEAWNWVVLQDHSLSATHARKVDEFLKVGQAFYDRIAQESPQSNILLYETWAYSGRHDVFGVTTTATAQFSSPDEMSGEIRKNYAALQAALQAKDPKRQILIAPVGTAFARCVREHPEIDVYAPDFKHPSPAGSYLSAAVIYAVLFHDSPVGAAPGQKVDPQEAKTLQQVASEAVAALRIVK